MERRPSAQQVKVHRTRKLKYVAILPKESKLLIERAFEELHWVRDTDITARHLLNISFGPQGVHYHKALEKLINQNDEGIGWDMSSLASKVAGKQSKQGIEVPLPHVNDNYFDLLWLGHIDSRNFIYKHSSKFKVVFNAMWKIHDLTNMGHLRDQLLQVRTSLLLKTKRVIPHFLLETYRPLSSELLSLQKLIHFELKTLPLLSF